MKVFYNIFLKLYRLFIFFASFWNKKASLWIQGRKNIFTKIQTARALLDGPIIWMHCASLGEFEQGRELLEKIKRKFPDYKFLLTFFSPSGYEIRKDYNQADIIFYLPMDGKKNAKKFLDIINPEFAIFIKYDSWYYYLSELKKRHIPTILVSAVFTPELSFFGIFGSFLRKMLEDYSHIFVQEKKSLDLLNKFNVKTSISISGDTRFDRVLEISESPFIHPDIEKFCSSGTTIIAGSTWAQDEELLNYLIEKKPQIKLVIAPHEISNSHIEKLLKKFHNSVLLSNYNEVASEKNVLIINSIGLLSKIYKYATICYVGGGFNKSGIHNILEAAVYGKTVIFGKNFGFSREALDLINLGTAYSVDDRISFVNIIDMLLSDSSTLEQKNKISKEFVKLNIGATEKIIHYLESNFLLTNRKN